ncbi:MAG: GC-type dockerin domain-anchored protein [Planctomycetota bacterium]|nr:GC-type dockerin domain-anchored protein [Planctomycetota bacterium]
MHRTNAFACIAVFTSLAAAEGGRARFIPLPTIPGGAAPYSAAFAVSDTGRFVCGASSSAAGTGPVVWDLDSLGVREVARFAQSTPGGEARALSASGSVVVGQSRQSTRFVAFRQMENESPQSLGSLAPSTLGTLSAALDTSADGAVIVGWSRNNQGTGAREAFIFRAGGMIGLGDLPGGTFNSTAHAITPDASLVVGEATDDRGLRAVVWSNSGMAVLPDPAGAVLGTAAYGVSKNGRVVVGKTVVTEGRSRATLWRDGVPLDLGTLPAADPDATALSCTFDGELIVGTSRFGDLYEAFMYDELGMRNLREVLVVEYGLAAELSEWELVSAEDVTPDGRVIVGQGTNALGQVQAWAVVLPTPCTGDYNRDQQVDVFDYLDFAQAYAEENIRADLDQSGQVDLFDYLEFAAAWDSGC